MAPADGLLLTLCLGVALSSASAVAVMGSILVVVVEEGLPSLVRLLVRGLA